MQRIVAFSLVMLIPRIHSPTISSYLIPHYRHVRFTRSVVSDSVNSRIHDPNNPQEPAPPINILEPGIDDVSENPEYLQLVASYEPALAGIVDHDTDTHLGTRSAATPDESLVPASGRDLEDPRDVSDPNIRPIDIPSNIPDFNDYKHRHETRNRKKVNVTIRNLDPSQYTVHNNHHSFDVQSLVIIGLSTDGGPDSLYTQYDVNSFRSSIETNHFSNIEFVIKHLDWRDDATIPRFFHEAIRIPRW